jgi:tRNA threonylcarbamoyladenosine biosynthesis protein TsaB
MSLILNIDTATEIAGVCLAVKGVSVRLLENHEQKDHAAWIHVAINEVLKQTNTAATNLEAIAVTIGPGSYTGLRVGLATAKGLCYALQKPLITIGTLEMMCHAATRKLKEFSNSLFCPMLDARRMEVFTAVYDANMEELLSPCAMLLEETSFSTYLDQQPVLFFGSGSKKWESTCRHPNAIFQRVSYSAENLAALSESKFNTHQFTGLAYSEPLYVKEFYTVNRR